MADHKAFSLAIENDLFRRGSYLVFWLIAVLAWFEFGQSAEDQVVDVAGDLTTMVAIVLVPVLLVGLITVPFYRWIARKLVGFIEDRDRPQA